MEISAIAPIGGNQLGTNAVLGNSFSGVSPLFDSSTMKVDEEYQGAAFADIITSAIENVKTTDATKNEMEYLLAVGNLDNPAELTIATAKAQTAIELLTQIRTKTLDSYSEIIRMQV